jgi:hypothetical protein
MTKEKCHSINIESIKDLIFFPIKLDQPNYIYLKVAQQKFSLFYVAQQQKQHQIKLPYVVEIMTKRKRTEKNRALIKISLIHNFLINFYLYFIADFYLKKNERRNITRKRDFISKDIKT